MCGVFGYVGNSKANLSDFIIDGLSKLEYRGYDSAGIAIFRNGKVSVAKEVGELKNLKRFLHGKSFSGNLGIGHTRWATHGGVTRKNAHPHADCSGKVVVVHNGIIENFETLKGDLIKLGHKFVSETDTEVFPHLVEENLKKVGISFTEAVRAAFNKLTGLNAIVACGPNGEIVAFRKGSPLVAGIGKGGNFISSDIPALSLETSRVVMIPEGQGALISKAGVWLVNAKSGKMRKARAEVVKMPEVVANKGDFSHFLLKEIYEQPEVVARVADNDKQGVMKAVRLIKGAWGTYFTACGTASYAALAAGYMFSEIAKRHVNFAVGSEFIYFEDFLVEKSLLIVASQSGETMDSLEAVRVAKRHGSKVLALVNVPGSSLTRLADYTILLKAGPERAVLSTKAYVAKLTLFLQLAYSLAGKYDEGVRLLEKTSYALSKALESGLEGKVKKLAGTLSSYEHIYIVGRGVNYPTALEGALKIKEASYVHAEGFAAGELKHGVIALIDKGTPCIAIVANDRAKEAVLSNCAELRSRGGFIIGISPDRQKVFDSWLPVPDVGAASPIVSIVPMQLLAYHLALLKGYNPDRPRNLAKSVTVK